MTYYIAQGTLLNVMWQPGWEGSWRENGYIYMYDWVPSLFSWNYLNCLLSIPQHKIKSLKIHIYIYICIYFKNYIKYRVLVSMTSEFLQQGLGIWLNMKTHWLKICWAHSKSLYSMWLRRQRIYHNVGVQGLIPGLGRSTGEGNGYPLQYS